MIEIAVIVTSLACLAYTAWWIVRAFRRALQQPRDVLDDYMKLREQRRGFRLPPDDPGV
jgi:hypothetical protein